MAGIAIPPQGLMVDPLTLKEKSLDPACALNEGDVYVKDVAGRTELFYEDDIGNVLQITSGGGLNLSAVTGVLGITHGGTGLSSAGTANQILGMVGAPGGMEWKTLTAGTGISITHAAGSVTIANTGKPASFTQTQADFYADGTNNNCDAIREWDNTDKCVYNKVTALASGSPLQSLQAVYAINLPTGFTAFASATAIQITYKTIDSTPYVEVLGVIDSGGTLRGAGLPAAAQNASKSTLTVTAAMLAAGTWTADTTVYVMVKLYGNTGTPFSTETAMVGPVKANFA